jgi:hypothetical protein
MGLKTPGGRKAAAGLAATLVVFLVVALPAMGTGEPTRQVSVEGSGPLRVGVAVVATGTVSMIGNEPFATLVLRTATTEPILLEITGPSAQPIRERHQGRTITVVGTVLRVPEGAQPGVLRVDELRHIYR